MILTKEFYQMTKQPHCKHMNVYHRYDFQMDKVLTHNDHEIYTLKYLEYKFRDTDPSFRTSIIYAKMPVKYKSIRTGYKMEDYFSIYHYRHEFYIQFYSSKFRFKPGRYSDGLAPRGTKICVKMTDRSSYFCESNNKSSYDQIVKSENFISKIAFNSYFSKVDTPLREKINDKLDFVELNNICVSIGSDNIYNCSVRDIDSGNADFDKHQMSEILFRYNGPNTQLHQQKYRLFLRQFICNRNKNSPTTNSTFRYMMLNTRKHHMKLAKIQYPGCVEGNKKKRVRDKANRMATRLLVRDIQATTDTVTVAPTSTSSSTSTPTSTPTSSPSPTSTSSSTPISTSTSSSTSTSTSTSTLTEVSNDDTTSDINPAVGSLEEVTMNTVNTLVLQEPEPEPEPEPETGTASPSSSSSSSSTSSKRKHSATTEEDGEGEGELTLSPKPKNVRIEITKKGRKKKKKRAREKARATFVENMAKIQTEVNTQIMELGRQAESKGYDLSILFHEDENKIEFKLH